MPQHSSFPIFMRAESYQNPKTGKPQYSAIGFYLSEKYDGQRAQWLAKENCLISRYGNRVQAPDWFIRPLLDVQYPLDGELFLGYNNWDLTGLFRSNRKQDLLWKSVKLIIFDIADQSAGTYRERRLKLESLFSERGWGRGWGSGQDGHIILIESKLAVDRSSIDAEFKKVIDKGGEGLMLNNPDRHYQDGKCDAILKYKKTMNEECIIVEYKMGNGRLSGKLGSFIVHPIEDGLAQPHRQFGLTALNESIRANYLVTHPIGTILHYRCAELTKAGIPKHPVYLGICKTVPVRLEETKAALDVQDTQAIGDSDTVSLDSFSQ